MGARPLARKIDELIRVPLSKRILFEQLRDCAITATMSDGKIDFRVDQPEHGTSQPGVDDNGFIVVDPITPST
jgi:hypothetical protein